MLSPIELSCRISREKEAGPPPAVSHPECVWRAQGTPWSTICKPKGPLYQVTLRPAMTDHEGYLGNISRYPNVRFCSKWGQLGGFCSSSGIAWWRRNSGKWKRGEDEGAASQNTTLLQTPRTIWFKRTSPSSSRMSFSGKDHVDFSSSIHWENIHWSVLRKARPACPLAKFLDHWNTSAFL